MEFMPDNMENELANEHTWTHEDENTASNNKANANVVLDLVGTHSNASWLDRDGISGEETYIERKMAQNYIDTTKEFYQGKLDGQKQLADAFFDAYKRDIDNSFGLYKQQRDGFDVLDAKIKDNSFNLYKMQRDKYDDVMGKLWTSNVAVNNKVDDIAFKLYKNERDNKDELSEKINCLQNKIDIMTAVRPYQDALINAKIDKNAIIADFNLGKRTCRMIQGDVVLPADPVVTGYPSQTPCGI